MILYFPKIRIVRCDEKPSSLYQIYTLHLRSQEKTPLHYPKHPLLEGKIELFGKLEDTKIRFDEEYKKILINATGSDKSSQIKGKIVSILIDFNDESSPVIKLIGLGKNSEVAYEFGNSQLKSSSIELNAKLNYELIPSKVKERKKTKI